MKRIYCVVKSVNEMVDKETSLEIRLNQLAKLGYEVVSHQGTSDGINLIESVILKKRMD